MKRDFKYNVILTIIFILFSLAAAFCQQKRIGEFVEIPHTDSTFSKNMPLGVVVLDTTAKELYRLTAYTSSGTSLTNASKVLISGDYNNGIYSGTDTVPSSTIAYLTDSLVFQSGKLAIYAPIANEAFNVRVGNFTNALNVAEPSRAAPTSSPFVGVNTKTPLYDEEFLVNGNSEFADDVHVSGQHKITGVGTTLSSFSLIANDNSANTNFYVRDDGAVNTRLGYWLSGNKILHQAGSLGNLNLWLGRDAGLSANSSAQRNFGAGYGSLRLLTSGNGNIGVGWYALSNVTTGNYNISIGISTQTHSSTTSRCFLLGYGTSSTANNQFVTGSITTPYNSYYFGRGVEQTQASIGSNGVGLYATSVAAGETDISATNFSFKIGGSKGTGTGDGGNVVLQIAPAGSSSSTQNSLIDALTINATTSQVESDITHSFKDGINFNTSQKWVFKEVSIGDWDMDATATIAVAHGLSSTEWKTIRNISVVVRNDSDDGYYSDSFSFSEASTQLGISSMDATNVNVDRLGSSDGGLFDSVNFDSTSYNRGYITFWYKL
jgi:hypothetical protein